MAKLCIMELVLWEILKATLNNLKRSSRRGNSEAEILVHHSFLWKKICFLIQIEFRQGLFACSLVLKWEDVQQALYIGRGRWATMLHAQGPASGIGIKPLCFVSKILG